MGKSLPPPDDLVLQYKEQVMYQNPKTGNSLMMYVVYYHACLAGVSRGSIPHLMILSIFMLAMMYKLGCLIS